MTLDSRTFRKALGCFPTGVTVVTTLTADGTPVGVTISSFTSLSLEPPLVLFCIDKGGQHEAFRQNGHFVVNVLRHEQRELSIRFASKLDDKWRGLSYDRNAGGLPVLKDCLATLDCTITEMHEGGDHHIVIGRVDALSYSEAGDPLLYFRGAYAGLGGLSVP